MTTRDRAARYLDDLGRMLLGLHPADRAEVLDSVREHIDTSVAGLGREPTDADMTGILAGLGPPGEVAREALADRPAQHPVPPPQRPALAGSWVPPTAILLIAVGALFAWLLVPVALLLGGIVLLCASPLWTPPEKVMGALFAPLAVAPMLGSLLFVVQASGEEPSGINALAVVIPALFVLAVGGLALLWVRGARRVADADGALRGTA